jgi:hypothetical protein
MDRKSKILSVLYFYFPTGLVNSHGSLYQQFQIQKVANNTDLFQGQAITLATTPVFSSTKNRT